MSPENVRPEDEELACVELVEVVTDYLEGAMPAHDRRRFEAHLDGCPHCITYVEQMRQVGGSLGALAADTIAPQTRDALLDAFRGWRDR
jgi:anti-sigma factor RsiW